MPASLFALIALITGLAARAADRPVAYVLDHEDQWTRSALAAQLLAQGGFEARPLPLDRSPADLADADLIFLASFSTEHPGYPSYIKEHADDLARFVESGGVLVQMAQADQTEASPPFLPAPLRATRCDDDFAQTHALAPAHPLLGGTPASPLAFHTTRTVWECFADQRGFQVLLAADAQAQRPALLEAAHGRGRILLSAVALDKTIAPADGRTPEADAALAAFRAAFFRNLAAHATAVREGRAPAPLPTPPPLAPEPFVPGSWTLAVLPDTQIYAEDFPGLFIAQTGWLLANRERLNIRFAVHLGDITNRNTPEQWRNARDAMKLLEGSLPHALVAGNHDYGPGGDASTRDTHLNEFFDFESHAAQPTFGGAMEPGKLDNTYHLFEAGGREWIVICLEWAPRDEAVAWANEVMARHPGRTGILVTHAYMFNDEFRYDHTDAAREQPWNPHAYRTPGSKNDGEQLWQKLVRRHNFALTLNGHVLGDGAAYLASTNDAGGTVHQILANYQMRELGGEGYLRLLEFRPDDVTVQVKTYSPVFDRWMLQPDQQFTLTLSPPAPSSPPPAPE